MSGWARVVLVSAMVLMMVVATQGHDPQGVQVEPTCHPPVLTRFTLAIIGLVIGIVLIFAGHFWGVVIFGVSLLYWSTLAFPTTYCWPV